MGSLCAFIPSVFDFCFVAYTQVTQVDVDRIAAVLDLIEFTRIECRCFSCTFVALSSGLDLRWPQTRARMSQVR